MKNLQAQIQISFDITNLQEDQRDDLVLVMQTQENDGMSRRRRFMNIRDISYLLTISLQMYKTESQALEHGSYILKPMA